MKRCCRVPVCLTTLAVLLPVLDFQPPRTASAQPRGRVRYKEGAVANGGSIQGTILWQGALPEAASLKVTVPAAQAAHCGGKEAGLERLIIDEKTRGVKDAVVYIEGISAGKKLPERDIDFMTGKKARLDQVGCHYAPHVMVVRRRSTLAITSSDGVLHNVNARMGLDQLFNLAFSRKGYTIDDPTKTNVGRKSGIISLRCNAGHFWMSGTVFVVNHPYYAVTGKDGTFALQDVPPGAYTVKVWHESWKPRLLESPSGQVVDVLFKGPVVLERKVEVEAGSPAVLAVDLSKAAN